MFGSLDLRVRAKLMRRLAEYSSEQSDKMMIRETPGASHGKNRTRLIIPIAQRIPRTTKTPQQFGMNHRWSGHVTIVGGRAGLEKRVERPKRLKLFGSSKK
jgi:hypothetical protein